MIARRTTSRARHASPGRMVCATLFSAALAVVAGAFAQPAVARAEINQQFYQFCITNLGQGNDYCCAHAGGTAKGGGCVDPATGNIISPAAAVRPGG